MNAILQMTVTGVVTTVKEGARVGSPSNELYDVRLVRSDGEVCLQVRKHMAGGDGEWQTARHTGTASAQKVQEALGVMTHATCGTGMPEEFGHALVLSNVKGDMCLAYIHHSEQRGMEFAIGATVTQVHLGAFCGISDGAAKFMRGGEAMQFTPTQAMDLLKSAFTGKESNHFMLGRGMRLVLAFEAASFMPEYGQHKPSQVRERERPSQKWGAGEHVRPW